MTQVTRKPTTAQVWRYDRQARAAWPQWAQDYEVHTPIGPQQIGAGSGVLLLPTRNGPTINVTTGEWLVYENGLIAIYSDAKVREMFDGVPAADAAPTTAEVVETPPAEASLDAGSSAEPAAQVEAPAAPAAKAKADKKPAGDKPAEDAPAE